jgi:hypothetical protein
MHPISDYIMVSDGIMVRKVKLHLESSLSSNEKSTIFKKRTDGEAPPLFTRPNHGNDK